MKKIDDMDWYDRQSLRALLIGGESSVGGLTRLAHIAMKAVAVKHMQHIVDLEPSLIIPYGAAWWAWDSKLSPVVVHTGNRVQDYPSSPEPEHKEL